MDSCYGWIEILSFQFQIKSINLTRIYQTVITTSVFRLDIFIVTLPSSSPPDRVMVTIVGAAYLLRD